MTNIVQHTNYYSNSYGKSILMCTTCSNFSTTG